MTLELALKATLLFALGTLAAALFRRRSAAEKHLIWMLTLGASLLLPLAQTAAAPAWSPVVFRVDAGGGVQTASFPLTVWLTRIYWVGLGLALARVIVSHVAMWVLTRRLAPPTQRGGMVRCGNVWTPMTWGLLDPVILLPEGESRAEVLLHEEAHVHRLDHLWRLISQLASAVYWFHPLAWWAARSATAEAEHACDDRVLATGGSALAYADVLINEARRLSSAPLAACGFLTKPMLESRVRALLEKGRSRRRLSPGLVMGGLLAASLLFTPTVLLRAEEEVHKIGGEVTTPRLTSKVEPSYTEEARDAGLEGTVILAVIINKHGRVTDTKVEQALGSGLEDEAIKAVKQWEFEPATRKGEPVAVRARIEVNFRLQ